MHRITYSHTSKKKKLMEHAGSRRHRGYIGLGQNESVCMIKTVRHQVILEGSFTVVGSGGGGVLGGLAAGGDGAASSGGGDGDGVCQPPPRRLRGDEGGGKVVAAGASSGGGGGPRRRGRYRRRRRHGIGKGRRFWLWKIDLLCSQQSN
jgi:hypothetical protein